MSHKAVILCAFLLLFVSFASSSISTGINIDPTNSGGNPSPSQISSLGAEWVRMEYKDSGSQPSQFGFYDPIISGFKQAGRRVLLIVDYSSVPGVPAYGSDWSNYINAFAARCTALAQHWGSSVDAYEIWNEEDLHQPGNSYDPGVDPNSYARLLKAAYQAIKGQSHSDVVVGGLCTGNPSYWASVVSANGGNAYADGLAVHPYGQRPYPNWPNPTWGFGNLQDLMHNYLNVAPHLPIWITEIGTNDVSVQDNFPWEAYTSINGSMPTQVPYVFWFCWSDAMVPPFGLVDASGNHKNSYMSYQKFALVSTKE